MLDYKLLKFDDPYTVYINTTGTSLEYIKLICDTKRTMLGRDKLKVIYLLVYDNGRYNK